MGFGASGADRGEGALPPRIPPEYFGQDKGGIIA